MQDRWRAESGRNVMQKPQTFFGTIRPWASKHWLPTSIVCQYRWFSCVVWFLQGSNCYLMWLVTLLDPHLFFNIWDDSPLCSRLEHLKRFSKFCMSVLNAPIHFNETKAKRDTPKTQEGQWVDVRIKMMNNTPVAHRNFVPTATVDSKQRGVAPSVSTKLEGSSGGVFPFGRELNQRESALGWIWKMGTYTKAASAIWVPWIHNTMPLTSKPQASGFSTFETRKKDCVGVAIGCQRMMER